MFDEDQLDSAERELETALRSLRPTPTRIDLVSVVSTGHRTSRIRLWVGSIAAAAVIMVAGGAWLALSRSGQIHENPGHRVPANNHLNASALKIPVEPPTLLVYRRALAQSSGELEAILDRHATMGMSPENTVVMLKPWNFDIHSSSGEL
jgi:hypothetical protein